MAEVAPVPAPAQLGTLKVPLRSLRLLLVAILLLAPIAILNKYVFLEANLLILSAALGALALVVALGRIPRAVVFPGVAFAFAVFVIYAWLRLDDPTSIDLMGLLSTEQLGGFAFVADLIIFYGLFVSVALLYYKSRRLSLFIWFLVCGYIVAFIVRNSFDVTGLQQGYNLSPGFVLLPLIPLVYIRASGHRDSAGFIPHALFVISILWLALIGARTAVGSFLLFLAALYAWPLITRNRFLYYGTFAAMWVALAALTVAYLSFVVYTGSGLFEDSGVGILQKGIGTRVDIWAHLAYLIWQQPWFGYGTDHSTQAVAPLRYMQFAFHRDNLSAHSLYFELLYRLGIVGLCSFILLLLAVWHALWKGRHLWEVRVAGAFLICATFFSATGEYLVFSEMRLRSGLGWVVLGIAAGATLREVNRRRNERVQSASSR
jgi:O-antigen ligase